MLIALVGPSGVGKSSIASLLEDKIAASFGKVHRFSLGEPATRFCMDLFGFREDQVYGDRARRETPDYRYVRRNGQVLSPEFALRTLKEWGRECWAEVWVERAVRRAHDLLDAGFITHAIGTDVESAEEARIVLRHGGQIWRVARPGFKDDPALAPLATRTIENAGSLADLQTLVYGMNF